MSRPSRILLSAAVLAAAAGAGLLWYPEPGRSFRAVDRPSALEGWKAPWATAGEPAAAPGSGPPSRWVVMGWDGASWEIALPLLEAGRLPHLARLMREGAYGDLRTFVPTQSPAVWTSVVTGVMPERHGIEGFGKRPRGAWPRLVGRLGGRVKPRLHSNADRRVKALWNLASDAGKNVLVVGYHNTFPAEKVDGVMVSNYVVRQGTRHVVPGASADAPENVAAHLVYPPQLLRRVTGFSLPIEDVAWEEIRPFADLDARRFRAKMARHRRDWRADFRWDYLLKAYAYDTFHGRVALDLRGEVDPDFLLLHFQGPDWAAHHFLYHHWPERYAVLPRIAEMRERLDGEAGTYRLTVAAFYEYADRWLGRLLEGVDAGTTGVMVLSDHGMDVQDYYRESGVHNDGPPGILVLAGPGIRHGRLAPAFVCDVLPTLAASTGLPVAEDLDGRVLDEVFEEGVLGHVRRVPSYESSGRFAPEVDLGAEFEQQMEEELRGLGYIQ